MQIATLMPRIYCLIHYTSESESESRVQYISGESNSIIYTPNNIFMLLPYPASLFAIFAAAAVIGFVVVSTLFFPFMPKTTHTTTRTRFLFLNTKKTETTRVSQKKRIIMWTVASSHTYRYWKYGGCLMVFVPEFVIASWRTLKKWLNYWVR